MTLDDLSKYTIFAFRNGLPLEVNLDMPALNYQASVVRLRLEEESSNDSSDFYSCGTVSRYSVIPINSSYILCHIHGLLASICIIIYLALAAIHMTYIHTYGIDSHSIVVASALRD